MARYTHLQGVLHGLALMLPRIHDLWERFIKKVVSSKFNDLKLECYIVNITHGAAALMVSVVFCSVLSKAQHTTQSCTQDTAFCVFQVPSGLSTCTEPLNYSMAFLNTGVLLCKHFFECVSQWFPGATGDSFPPTVPRHTAGDAMI